MSILSTQKVEASYENRTVFSNLNVAIQEGTITTIIGPNGCGKSTLLKTMSRILKHTRGSIFLQGQDLQTMKTKQIAKQLSMLPQHPTAPDELMVEELISYGRFPHRKNLNKLSSEDKETIKWAMDITRTTSFKDRDIGTLSGGQKQKVWLAMALAQKTEVLLLDEPTTYLDMAHQLEVLKIIEELNQHHHCTIVLVLHDINQAARFSDDIVGMRNGEVITTGTPKEIMNKKVLRDIFQIEARVMIDPHNGSPVCYGYENIMHDEKQTVTM